MMTRHEFLWSLLGLGVGAATLAACGTDTETGDPGGPDEPGADAGAPPTDAGNPSSVDANPGVPPTDGGTVMTCAAIGVQIGSNHGHTMTVAPADLDSTSPRTYDITGTSDHPHTVIITPAQFASLRANGTLTVSSSTDDGHPHTVNVTCG